MNDKMGAPVVERPQVIVASLEELEQAIHEIAEERATEDVAALKAAVVGMEPEGESTLLPGEADTLVRALYPELAEALRVAEHWVSEVRTLVFEAAAEGVHETGDTKRAISAVLRSTALAGSEGLWQRIRPTEEQAERMLAAKTAVADTFEEPRRTQALVSVEQERENHPEYRRR